MRNAKGSRHCENETIASCNWAVPSDGADRLCLSCSLTTTRPADEDLRTGIGMQFAEAEMGKRRLIFQLLALGLDLSGLSFDLLASGAQRVSTGHENGRVTINLEEANESYRAKLQAELSEPYRTVLGHLRHEVGHFFQDKLLPSEPEWERCRGLFGDDRADYAAALKEHYDAKAPTTDWQTDYVSRYATAHPWEDWAETFAHVLHILDTTETAASFGLRSELALPADPTQALAADTMDDVLAQWRPLSAVLNAVNRSMGRPDLYPFVITQQVAHKLGYVHERILTTTRSES